MENEVTSSVSDCTSPGAAPENSQGSKAESPSKRRTPMDPLKVLECMKTLLNSNGGIKSINEVQRIEGIMAKFSKKVISKCIYLNILQATKSYLLDAVYNGGGWNVIRAWLMEARDASNWPLCNEILKLLLKSPVTIERLQQNDIPKLVKEIMKECPKTDAIQNASQLMKQWAKVIRSKCANSGNSSCSLIAPSEVNNKGQLATLTLSSESSNVAESELSDDHMDDSPECANEDDVNNDSSSGTSESEICAPISTPIRITIKSGDQVLAKVSSHRLSHDSTDSEDNKPLSVIRKEVLDKKCKETDSDVITEDCEKAIQDVDKADNNSLKSDLIKTEIVNQNVNQIENQSFSENDISKTDNEDSSSEKSTLKNEVCTGITEEDDNNNNSEMGILNSSFSNSITDVKTDRDLESINEKNLDISKESAEIVESLLCENEVNAEKVPMQDAEVKDEVDAICENFEKKEKDRHKHRSDKSSKGSHRRHENRHSKERNHEEKSHHSHHRSKDKKGRPSTNHEKKHSSSSRKNSSSRDRKESIEKEVKQDDEQAEMDRVTLEKTKPHSVEGMAKIPKKSPVSKSFGDALGSADVDIPEKKYANVKMKSRGFRKTGLFEEPSKPPGIAGKRAPHLKSIDSNPVALKRPLLSIPEDSSSLKRPKPSFLSTVGDRPGGVKVISPKRPSLSDDGGFMAALTASGLDSRPKRTTRKRRSSESDPKEQKPEEAPKKEGDETLAAPLSGDEESPLSPSNLRPTENFYKEAFPGEGEESERNEDETQEMETEDSTTDEVLPSKEVQEEPSNAESETPSSPPLEEEMEIPMAPAMEAPVQEDYEKVEVTFTSEPKQNLKSIIVYHRGKTEEKKKDVRWKDESRLKEIFYFELDETERVNVNTLKFQEMMVMEKAREKEIMGRNRALSKHLYMDAFEQSSKVTEKMPWHLIPLQLPPPKNPPGYKSEEKVTQAARERSTMAAFFHPFQIPETPIEPDPEFVVREEPKRIPLQDVTGAAPDLKDHRQKPWPEPFQNSPNVEFRFGMPPGLMGHAPAPWVMGNTQMGGFPGGPLFHGSGGPGFGDMSGWAAQASMGPGHMNMDYGPQGGGPMMMMMGSMSMRGRGILGVKGNRFPRSRGGGGKWNNKSTPHCRHFMMGYCKHGKDCKFLHEAQNDQ